MSDFTRLCTESSLKIIYGNFPLKSSAGEPSEAQQPETSYIIMYVSMDSIFSLSCQKGDERLPLNYILEKLGFTAFQSYLLSPCVKEQQMISGQRKRYHRRKIQANVIPQYFGERTKHRALLHGVTPYGVPKWSPPKNHLLVKLNTLCTYLFKLSDCYSSMQLINWPPS